MRILVWIILCSLVGSVGVIKAQEAPPLAAHLAVVDDIQIDLKTVTVSPSGDTVTVELFIISLQKHPREFKLNTFASGLVDSKGTPYLYSEMQMGKVRIAKDDRQNYLHYLLSQDTPVLLQIRTGGWSPHWGKPQHAKLTFEDSNEEGKFLEVALDLVLP